MECSGTLTSMMIVLFLAPKKPQRLPFEAKIQAHANFILPARNHCQIWQHSQTMSL